MTRADRADRALHHLGNYVEEPGDIRTAVVDLVADLCHLLEREDVDPYSALTSAQVHYEAERPGGEDDEEGTDD